MTPVAPIPVYAKVLDHGKKRRVRRFGQVRAIDSNGVASIVRESGFFFIKNEPKTIYTRKI